MKYYYLSCSPTQRNSIKQQLRKFVESPYSIVDRLEACDTLLIVGPKTPDILKLQEEARRLKIQIQELDAEKLQKQRVAPVRRYSKDYSREL